MHPDIQNLLFIFSLETRLHTLQFLFKFLADLVYNDGNGTYLRMFPSSPSLRFR
jgi:hypothetical protein